MPRLGLFCGRPVPGASSCSWRRSAPFSRCRRVVLRRFRAVEHAVVTNHPDAAAADRTAARWYPFLGGGRVTPRGEEDELALLRNALEDVPVDEARLCLILWRTEPGRN